MITPSLRVLGTALLVALLTAAASAQTYYWSAFVGQPPQPGNVDGTGAAARFYSPWGLTTDAADNIYVVDAASDIIRRVTATGVVTTLAGGIGLRGFADGFGASARFASPSGITVANGALFVTDRLNHTIRRVSSGGIVTTFAGRPGIAGSADGSAASARFNEPFSLTNDSSGNLYVADSGNHTIRKITPDGEVTTLAGQPGVAGSADGTGNAARFNQPAGIFFGAGAVYVSDTYNHTIRRVATDGTVTTIAGSPGISGTASGTGATARFAFPRGLVVYNDGTIVVCDSSNSCIRVISPAGAVATLTGRVNVEGSRDGLLPDARFYVPTAIAFLNDGLVVADTRNYSIRKIGSASLTVTTLAGPGGNFGSEDGVGPQARFNYPSGVAVHSSGDIYLADSRGNSIRRITPEGVVTSLVTGGEEFYVDGPAGVAKVNYPLGVAVAPDRSVYFCEQQRHTIRVLRPDGSVSTLAGTVGVAGSADGVGTAARFNFPSGVALDADGNVFVGDAFNHTIRRIAAGTNVVTTFAGQAGISGSADGAGAAARFRFPRGLSVDPDGNVFVADEGNHTIRRITREGVVSTVAGLAGAPGAANGSGAAARFTFPSGVTAAGNGVLYVADTLGETIRKIAGDTVTTIGGTAAVSGFYDAVGTNAWMTSPNSVAIDSRGVLYVSEAGNNIVRKSEPLTTPVITTQPRPVTVPTGSSATFSVAATGAALSYQWRINGVALSGATNATLTLANVEQSAVGNYTVTIGNPIGSVTSDPAALALGELNDSRIVNLSILAALSSPGDSVTMGFVIGGGDPAQSKPLVLRAAGPSLGALGVAGTLDDPKLELFVGAGKIGENDNWGGAAALATAMQNVGAFAFTGPASRDAAFAGVFKGGAQSVKVSAAGNGTGSVLAEIYDASPAATVNATTPRLVNVSVLKHIGAGLTAGFSIAGNSSKSLLIRAVGPTLGAAPFNVGGVLADPQLTLYSGQTIVTTNDNWGGGASLVAAFNQVSAFALAAGSRDAALVATLAPGSYTVQVTGVGGTTGVALVEIYELP